MNCFTSQVPNASRFLTCPSQIPLSPTSRSCGSRLVKQKRLIVTRRSTAGPSLPKSSLGGREGGQGRGSPLSLHCQRPRGQRMGRHGPSPRGAGPPGSVSRVAQSISWGAGLGCGVCSRERRRGSPRAVRAGGALGGAGSTVPPGCRRPRGRVSRAALGNAA